MTPTHERQADRLRANLDRVRAAIREASRRTGRDPAQVELIAVTKSAGLETIRALLAAGVIDLGESRVQQLVDRARGIAGASDGVPAPRWHMIGHLQRNKVRALLRHCRTIHSLDSQRLADELESEACRIDAMVDAYLEVNVSGEAAKGGVTPEEASSLIAAVQRQPHLRLRGLMTMAPLSDDAERSRPHFARLRELLEALRCRGVVDESCDGLSMGMSQDYVVAVEEGATAVRIGSALFEGLDGV